MRNPSNLLLSIVIAWVVLNHSFVVSISEEKDVRQREKKSLGYLAAR